MELSELNETEQLVLVGLAKAVVHADHEVTEEETAAIRALAAAMGADVWNKRVAEAREKLVTAEQLFDLARSIARIEARHTIHRALRTLAESDALDDAERELLDWVADVWQLGVARLLTEEEEDDDDVTYDDEFVLFEVGDDDESFEEDEDASDDETAR